MSPRELALDLEQFINRGLIEGWRGWPLARCRIPSNRPLRPDEPKSAVQARKSPWQAADRTPSVSVEQSFTMRRFSGN